MSFGLLLPLGLAAAVLLLSRQGQRAEQAGVELPASQMSSRYKGHDYARSIADNDAAIQALRQRIASPQGDLIDRESLSLALAGRSRLTGNFADLHAARIAVDEGIAMSPPGTGPWLAKASVEFSGHRLAETQAALDVVDRFVAPDGSTRAEAKAMRSDIALARGRYGEARRLLVEAERIEGWSGLHFRKAVLARAEGDFDGARRHFAAAYAASRDPTPQFRSDLLMRIGEIDFAQGRWGAARERYEEAGRALPGYWRAHMRLAQMDAIAGKLRPALATFERIAEEHQEPDAMYAAAGLNRDLGDTKRAQQWIDRAAAIWKTRLQLLPEAAWGHAIEHELAFGTPDAALELAQKNAANRPYGVPLLLLAEAWIAKGKPDKALEICRKVEASGWVSADQWTIRALALEKLGRQAEARSARSKALAINPREYDDNPALAWFHD